MFASIDNFRDYGGYPTAGGKLRTGLLYRSAHFCEATPADLNALAALNLTAIIDLRGPLERERAPSPKLPIPTVTAELDTSGVAPHLQAAVKGVKDIPAAIAAMQAVYADFPRREMINAALRDYFTTLATTTGASLVHCAAGKDRTGLAVALLHAALGVHHDDIVADYLLTNTVGDAEKRIATGIFHVRANFGPDVGAGAAHALVTVKAQYLEAAFATITETYGSLDAYFLTLGVTPAKRDALAARLATPP